MKSVMEYLQEQQEAAQRDLSLCTNPLKPDRPMFGLWSRYYEAKRELEIINYLIRLADEKRNAAKPTQQAQTLTESILGPEGRDALERDYRQRLESQGKATTQGMQDIERADAYEHQCSRKELIP